MMCVNVESYSTCQEFCEVSGTCKQFCLRNCLLFGDAVMPWLCDQMSLLWLVLSFSTLLASMGHHSPLAGLPVCINGVSA